MKDPEYAAAERELYASWRRAQAAMLRSWEKHGPEWWRRLAMLFFAAAMGYMAVFSVWFLSDSLELFRSYNFGFPWQVLFLLLVTIGLPLFFRFLPQTRPYLRHFDWEVGLGFGAGVVLTVLLAPPWT